MQNQAILRYQPKSYLPAMIIALAIFVGLLTGLFGGLIAIIVVVPLVVVIAIALNYRAGIWLLMFLTPFAYTKLIPHKMFGMPGLNPVNFFLMLTVGSILLFLVMRRKIEFPQLPKIAMVYLAMFVLAAIAGSFKAHLIVPMFNSEGVLEPVTKAKYLMENFFKPSIVFFTAGLLGFQVLNARSSRNLTWAMAGCLIMFSFMILAFVALISGVSLHAMAGDNARRILSWTGMHANELGLFFNIGFALCLFSGLKAETRFARFVFLSIAALCCGTAILTFSRGAFLGITLIGLYYVATRRKFSQLILAISLALGVILVLPSAFFERATTSGHGDVSAGRVELIWKPLLPEFFNSPVFGHGLTSTLWAKANRTGQMLSVGHPHSAYLGVLLDFGLAGAVVVFLFFRSMWRLFQRLKNEHPEPFWQGYFEGASVCLLVLLIQGVTDDRFVPTAPQIFLWFAYGIALGFAKLYRWNPDGSLPAKSTLEARRESGELIEIRGAARATVTGSVA